MCTSKHCGESEDLEAGLLNCLQILLYSVEWLYQHCLKSNSNNFWKNIDSP